MKKYYSLLISVLALWMLISCETQDYVDGIKKTSNLEEMKIKGPIKTLKVKKYKATKNTRTGKILKRDLSKSNPQNLSYMFNENGNMIEKTAYGTDGQINSKWTYEYDEEKGQVIERVYNDPDDEPTFKRVNYYDKNGNKTKHLDYSQEEDDDPYKETFKYDKNGNILEEVNYVNSGPLKILYTYDDEGNLIEKSELMADNQRMKETYEYDEDGKLVASKQDEDRTTHASFKIEKKYEDDKETKRIMYRNGEPDGRFVYKYDDRGNKAGYQKYDLDNNVVSEEKIDYEYDQNDNWIKKIPLNKRGIPLYLLEREIEYFDK